MDEDVAAEVAAWQQLYQSWLRLVGGDTVEDALNQWNAEMVDGLQSVMAPSWQIPLRWLEDMNRIIESGNIPEPVQSLALQTVKTGKAAFETVQQCSISWFQAAPSMRFDGGAICQYWIGPAVASQQAWQEAVHSIWRLNANLFLGPALSVEKSPAGTGNNAQDIDMVETETPVSAKSEVKSERRNTKNGSTTKAQEVPSNVSL